MGVLKGCGDLWAFWCNGRTDKVICRGPLAHKKRMVNSYCQHYCSAPIDRSMEVKLGQTDLPADQPTDGQIGSWESLNFHNNNNNCICQGKCWAGHDEYPSCLPPALRRVSWYVPAAYAS